jgi:hypothetical protein
MYSHEQICTLLQRTAQIANSNLWLGALAQTYSIPIDPCQFDNGPATVGVPSIQFEKGGQLTKRL